MGLRIGTNIIDTVYLGDTEVDKVYLGSVQVLPAEAPPSPTGTSGMTIFTSNGSILIPSGATVTYLIVAGGGAGGSNQLYIGGCNGGYQGAGGGAGGFLSGSTTTTGGTFSAVIGAGGAPVEGGNFGDRGGNGENSTFMGLTAYGGGGGANSIYNSPNNGGNGGSGGGATYRKVVPEGGALCQSALWGTVGTGVAGQGNAGSTSIGGGAGGTPTGRQSDISGTLTTYSTGNFSMNNPAIPVVNGAANTGNAGQGATNWGVGTGARVGGYGGSGIVIVKWVKN